MTNDLPKIMGELGGFNAQDFTTTLQELVGSLNTKGDNWVSKTPDGEMLISNSAMRQVVTDRLGGTISLFNDKDITPKLKHDYILQKAARLPDHEVIVRASNGIIGAVLSDKYRLFDNRIIIGALLSFQAQGHLPGDDLQAHKLHISKDGRQMSLRLISPTHWNFKNGQPYYGGLAISNDETGHSPLVVSPCLARVACFNYCLAKSIVKVHRYDEEEMSNALFDGVTHITTYAEQMFERQQQMKGVKFDKPEVLFRLIGEKMKLPEYVREATEDYWRQEGSGNSVYDVVQALTWGSQAFTDHSEKKQRWADRDDLETKIWSWADDEVMNLHTSGGDINSIVNQAELVSRSKVLGVLSTSVVDPIMAVEQLPVEGWLR
jgi:hypothetical protein